MFSNQKGSRANLGLIDHCHNSTKVRGILCLPCNTSIGYIENNKIDLDNLKEYIKNTRP